jgi:hypothetical protein
VGSLLWCSDRRPAGTTSQPGRPVEAGASDAPPAPTQEEGGAATTYDGGAAAADIDGGIDTALRPPDAGALDVNVRSGE